MTSNSSWNTKNYLQANDCLQIIAVSLFGHETKMFTIQKHFKAKV